MNYTHCLTLTKALWEKFSYLEILLHELSNCLNLICLNEHLGYQTAGRSEQYFEKPLANRVHMKRYCQNWKTGSCSVVEVYSCAKDNNKCCAATKLRDSQTHDLIVKSIVCCCQYCIIVNNTFSNFYLSEHKNIHLFLCWLRQLHDAYRKTVMLCHTFRKTVSIDEPLCETTFGALISSLQMLR